MAKLDALPLDLLKRLSSTMDLSDFVKLGKISKTMAAICNNREFWEFKIQSLDSTMSLSEYSSVTELIELYQKLISRGWLYIWGKNEYGRLGLGDISEQLYPILLDRDHKIIQVSCGEHQMGYVTYEGYVYVCGAEQYRQFILGFNPTYMINKPKQIPGFTDVVQIVCKGRYSAFITQSGKVYTFGVNESGQLGIGISIDNFGPVPTLVKKLSDVKITQIACGVHHMAAIDNKGNVYLWGSSSFGQLGSDTFSTQHEPMLNGYLNGIKEVSCGDTFTLFLTKEGKVYISGVSFSGSGYELSPIPKPLDMLFPIKQISAGPNYIGVLSTEGEVYVVGNNSYNQLGLSNSDSQPLPVKVSHIPKMKKICCGPLLMMMISEEEKLYVSGYLMGTVYSVPTHILNLDPVIYLSSGLNYCAVISKNEIPQI